MQRYIELGGELQKVMTVVKLRARDHSKQLRPYAITENGIAVGEAMSEYRGLLTGHAEVGELAPKRPQPKRSQPKRTAKKTRR